MNARATGTIRVRALGALACATATVTAMALGPVAGGAPAPPTSLQSLARPTVSAPCAGASILYASPSRPLVAEGDVKVTRGVGLVGAACDASFTWTLPGGATSFHARLELGLADSGPQRVTFLGDGRSLRADEPTRVVTMVRVPFEGVTVSVPVRRVHRFTVELLGGGDAGIVLVTGDRLAR